MTVQSPPSRASWRITTIIAAAFLVGSLTHLTAWLLLSFGVELYGPEYPGLRHAALALIDGSIAWIAVRHPRRLFFALLAFLFQQTAGTGAFIWRQWTSTHQLVPGLVVIYVFVLVATVASGFVRYTSRAPYRQPS